MTMPAVSLVPFFVQLLPSSALSKSSEKILVDGGGVEATATVVLAVALVSVPVQVRL